MKNFMRKMMSVFVAMTMMLSISMSSFAAQPKEQDGEIAVSYDASAEESYTLVVPEAVEFDEIGDEKTGTLGISSVILSVGNQVEITITSDFELANEFHAQTKLSYTVDEGEDVYETEQTIAQWTSATTKTLYFKLSDQALAYASNYTGSCTFNADIVEID